VVFRGLLRNRNGYTGSEPWECDLIEKSTSIETLSRLALADSRARAWVANIEQRLRREQLLRDNLLNNELRELSEQRARRKVSDEPTPILKWAPQLVTLHHPFITQGGRFREIASEFLDALTFYTQGRDDVMAIVFCMVATTLHYCSAAMKDVSVLSDFLEGARSLSTSYPAQVGPLGEIVFRLVHDGYRMLGDVTPPPPYRIPFEQYFNALMPFSSSFTEHGHLAGMRTPEFLTIGEWVGFYNYSVNLRQASRWDAPMNGIRFSLDPDTSPTSVKGSGVDSVGGFTLVGSIGRRGEISMRKHYNVQGFFWDWNASMTPFGIVGRWGRDIAPHGYFWLWKRDWSDG
jgi:hypothetical protein